MIDKWLGRRHRPVMVADRMRMKPNCVGWYCSDCGAGFRSEEVMFMHSVRTPGLWFHCGFSRVKPPHRGPADVSMGQQMRNWLSE